MSLAKVCVVDHDIVSSFGLGSSALWQGIKENRSAIRRFERFNVDSFKSSNAAFIDKKLLVEDNSILMSMFKTLNFDFSLIAADARLIFASTVGEIDLLEKSVKNKSNDDVVEYGLLDTAKKINNLFGFSKVPYVLSAACASSTAGLSRALSLIRSGEEDCVVIAAGDIISEFVYSGFSSLMALDDNRANPFDINRAGLSIGEAAGYVVLASEAFVNTKSLKVNAKLVGGGQSTDANHMTGPSRDGSGLALAIERALNSAKINADDISFISAHGTGTKYNDSMELKAFKSVFKVPLPTYSIKGAIGHTMGSAGLAQMIVALNALNDSLVPSTVGLNVVDAEAQQWANISVIKGDFKHALVVNAGFGGLNAAVVLEKEDDQY